MTAIFKSGSLISFTLSKLNVAGFVMQVATSVHEKLNDVLLHFYMFLVTK